MKPRGRPFAKGNPGGPGRPKREVEESYLVALRAEVSIADWQKVAKKAVEQAKEGDDRARTWLSKYLLPAELADPVGDGLQRLVELLAAPEDPPAPE